jgi:FAD/FMN-containing dehydrogenase
VIGECLPAAAWQVLPSAADDPLAHRLRSRFDPHRILNRGILGESIA